MSQIIPGGRPRASSDGDILDEGSFTSLFVDVNSRHNVDGVDLCRDPTRLRGRLGLYGNTGSRSRDALSSIPKTKYSYKPDADNSWNSVSDAFDSDSEISSQSRSSSIRSSRSRSRRRFSFKSMRKAVSRAFLKEEGAVKKNDKSSRHTDYSKIWTPELRHIGQGFYGKMNGSEMDNKTMSTARPLITDPSIGMTTPRWRKTPGTVGIYNHGNSCFMNAVLQCLSNTDSFTEYFVRDFYKDDLKNNKNGKKGVFRSTHGEVTEQLGSFLKNLWSGTYTSDVSKDFKAVVGKFNSQYKGDHQHDSQEFLLWLLDRVHEDVSTFNKKKMKSPKVGALKSDDELAAEAKSVNGDSFILKLFQALHSSTLTCPMCGQHSSTFDPYLCVSLPLPQYCPRTVYLVVVYLHGQVVKMAVTLNQYEGIRDLRQLVAQDADIPFKQIVLCQLKNDGFGCTYSDDQPLSDLPENQTLYAIEMYSTEASLHTTPQEYDSATAQVLAIHIEVAGGSSRSSRFGAPTVLRVRRDISWKELQKNILKRMEGAVCEEIISQKLSVLFSMRLYDGSSHRNYLPSDVDMPLYTQTAERALGTLNEDYGPAHIKLVTEWDPQTKGRVVVDDQEHFEVHQSFKDIQASSQAQGKVSLEECFKLYTQEEKLIGEDAWLCPHCKQQQQGTIKTLGLWSLPDILVLHLKRFKQSGLRRSKLNTLVDFPVDNLDMYPYLMHQNDQNKHLRQDDYTYNLLGVCNHYGNMMGGHYTAYCRSPVDGEWREFNDTKVRILDGAIATRDAYILFYQRRSLGKDINQKLFVGDHWVFSLSLAPSEKVEDEAASSPEALSPRAESQNGRLKRSRSRSVSPTSHRRETKDLTVSSHRLPSRPLTPQPSRRSAMYWDEEEFIEDYRPTSPHLTSENSPVRRSRPLHRQMSEPKGQHRRGRSAGAKSPSGSRVKDSSRTYDKRRVQDDDSVDNLEPLSRTTQKPENVKGVAGRLDKGRHVVVNVVRHDSNVSGASELSSTASRNLSHQTKFQHPSTLQSDAKYPLSYDHSKYSGRRNGHMPYYNDYQDDIEQITTLRVNLEEDDARPHSYSLKSHMDASNESGADSARRMLAQHVKQSSLDKTNAERSLANFDTIKEEDTNFLRNAPRYRSQKSYEIAAMNAIDMNFPEALQTSNYNTANGHIRPGLDNLLLDTRGRDQVEPEERPRKHNFNTLSLSSGYSRLHDEQESYVLNSDSILSPGSKDRSDLRSRLSHEDFRNLAEKHFGGDRRSREFAYDRDKYSSIEAQDKADWDRDHIADYSSKKFATIARSRDMSPSRRQVREEALSMPRSNTDHSIRYTSARLAPPPSPTPPHSLKEERTFHSMGPYSTSSTSSEGFPSGRLNSREISIHSFQHAGRRPSDQDSVLSTGHPLPNYTLGHRTHKDKFHPRPHRGIWGVVPKAKATKSGGSVPTPCLRESSV